MVETKSAASGSSSFPAATYSMYAQPQPTHIPQPPHTSGRAFAGLRTRIQPEQIPSPTDVAQDDEEQWEGQTFTSLPGKQVPLSTTKHFTVDQGNASPRFMRLTTWCFPVSYDLARSCQVPLAAIIQPFANDPMDEEVQVVDSGSLGPARCSKCRGYVNPWCTWTHGGMKWRCNLCQTETEVDSDYFSNTDANFMRLDHAQRPELQKGTIDFIVPPDYHAPHAAPRLVPSYFAPEEARKTPRRTPSPMHFIFLLDVSMTAIQCGFTNAACAALKSTLYGNESQGIHSCFPSGCTISIVSFDDTIHFYDLAPDTPQASMFVLSDLDEVFSPLRHQSFTDPMASKSVIEKLLDSLPARFHDSHVGTSALGSALRASLAAVAGFGGHVILFQSSLCTVGAGALGSRPDESTLYDTDKEKTLFVPRDRMWRDLGEEYAEEGIGLSMFVGTGPQAYVDLGSIGAVTNTCGGDLFYYPRFDLARDYESLESHLRRLLSRQMAYNCTIRVRCSEALNVSSYVGTFEQSSPTDITLGLLDEDTSFGVTFEHAGFLSGRKPLTEREYAHVQCAVLYTTITGQRRLRTINVAVQVTSLAAAVFRAADLDATVCLWTKEAMLARTAHKLSDLREGLPEKCGGILLSYRRTCAAATAPSQLILPEAYKLLPLFTLGLQKSRAVRGHNVPADIRNHYAHRLLTMPVSATMRHLYPRFCALHNLRPDSVAPLPPKEDGLQSPDWFTQLIPGVSTAVRMPYPIRNTYTCMEPHGIYLIDNEDVMVLWIGTNVDPQHVVDLFGVNSIQEIDTRLTSIPFRPNLLSAQLHTILAHRAAERRGLSLKMLVARQNQDAAELELSDMLVEDRNCGAMSYIDYLCYVHKQINVALTSGSNIGEGRHGLAMRGGTAW